MKFTAICTRTRPTFLFTCCLLFITFRQKLVVSRHLYTLVFFWAFFISLFSILRNFQLESDVCRLPESATLSLSQYWLSSRLLTLSQQTTRNIIILFQTVYRDIYVVSGSSELDGVMPYKVYQSYQNLNSDMPAAAWINDNKTEL